MELSLQTLCCFYNKDFGIIPSHPSHHASFLTHVSSNYGVGYLKQPSPRDNFTERLYDKKLSRLTEIKLTLINYSEILL